jgi:hypothetical protein
LARTLNGVTWKGTANSGVLEGSESFVLFAPVSLSVSISKSAMLKERLPDVLLSEALANSMAAARLGNRGI